MVARLSPIKACPRPWASSPRARGGGLPCTGGRGVAGLRGSSKAVVVSGHGRACHGGLWRPHAAFPDVASERAVLEGARPPLQPDRGALRPGRFVRGGERGAT